MIKLKIKQKEGRKTKTLEVKIPESQQELNVYQFLEMNKIEDKSDTVRILKILTGIDKIGEITEDKVIEKLRVIIASIFTDNVNWEKLIKKVPKTVLVKGKELKVKKFGKFTLSQRIVFEQLLYKEKPETQEDLINLIPEVNAIAFQPEYFGKSFSKDRHEEMVKIINSEPIVRQIAPAYFFLIILMSLTATGAVYSLGQSVRTLIVNMLRKRQNQKDGKSLLISA